MTRVFEYGLPFDPFDGAELVDEQILLAHRYYNKLIELEHTRRSSILAVQRADPKVGPLLAAYDAANAEVEDLLARKREAKSRDRRVAAPELSEIEAAKEARRHLSVQLRKVKKVATDRLKPEYDLAEQATRDAKKAARAASGVFWGTYSLIEQAADAAAKAKPVLRPGTHPRPWDQQPSFRRWTGEGMVAVQININRPLNDVTVFGDDLRLRITPVDPAAWSDATSRGDRKCLARTNVTMRVGRNTGETATWPMVMHRPLPAGSRVTWAKVLRRRLDDRPHWFKYVLQLTVETADAPRHPGLVSLPPAIVAINCGWRALPNGSLRVVTWVGSDGAEGVLDLGCREYRDRIERAESIRSVRDQLRNELTSKLVGIGIDVTRWRSFDRFHRLFRELTAEGCERNEAVELLEAWHHRDRHLRQYQDGARGGALRFRREQYRLLAVELARRYPVVCVESWDLRPVVTDEDRLPGPAAARVEGASSTARLALASAATREGCVVLTQIAAHVRLQTQTCHVCGYGAKKGEEWDAAAELVHTCEGCGETWNQDVNFCRNILAASRAAVTEIPELLVPKIMKRSARFAARHKKVAT